MQVQGVVQCESEAGEWLRSTVMPDTLALAEVVARCKKEVARPLMGWGVEYHTLSCTATHRPFELLAKGMSQTAVCDVIGGLRSE